MTNDRSDDLDWLYRRGTYAEGEGPTDATRAQPAVRPDPWRTPSPQPGPAPQPYPQSQYRSLSQDVPPPRPPAAPPTPVGDYSTPPSQGRPVARKRRRPRWRRVLIALVALILVYLVGVPVVAWSQGSRVDATPDGERPAAQPGHLFLLAGSDAREGLTNEEKQRIGTGSTEGRRADTIMLLYIPDHGKSALISLPRDSYVRIPGHGRNKINAAYALGGPKLLVQTVEANTGLRVDSYAEIGFGGFVNMIDAVGGIEMCPKHAIVDRDSHLNLKAGCQQMDGVTALNYVRMRKADPEGDLGRVKRQREMLAALANKVASPVSVLNPARYWGLNAAGARALRTGTDTGVVNMAQLGIGMMGIASGSGHTLTMPVSTTDARTAAGSSVLWDKQQSQALFDELKRGDTSQLGRFHK